MFASKEILDIAIRLEKNGEAFYKNVLEKEGSAPSLNALLKRLAEDEVKHSKWFAQRKEDIENSDKNPGMEEMADSILKEIMGDQTFSLKEKDLSQIHDAADLIKIAIEFENDTIVFYEMLKTFIREADPGKEIDEIIEEEKSHVVLLEKELLSIA